MLHLLDLASLYVMQIARGQWRNFYSITTPDECKAKQAEAAANPHNIKAVVCCSTSDCARPNYRTEVRSSDCASQHSNMLHADTPCLPGHLQAACNTPLMLAACSRPLLTELWQIGVPCTSWTISLQLSLHGMPAVPLNPINTHPRPTDSEVSVHNLLLDCCSPTCA